MQFKPEAGMKIMNILHNFFLNDWKPNANNMQRAKKQSDQMITYPCDPGSGHGLKILLSLVSLSFLILVLSVVKTH